MRKILPLLTITALLLTTAADSSRRDVKCAKLDSCAAKPRHRTCSCEDGCTAFGTCCRDYSSSNDRELQSYYCYDRRIARPVFAKRSCVEGYCGHPGTVAACKDVDVDYRDFGHTRIVTSSTTKVTYWNRHCALCNEEREDDLEPWTIAVQCPARTGVDAGVVRRNLTFGADQKAWGLRLGGEFVACSVKYERPYYVEEGKHCTPNLISSCPDYYLDKSIAAKCSQYYGERRRKHSSDTFKNVHCAICNGLDLKELECSGMSQPEDSAGKKEPQDMIKVEFTKGRWLDFEEGKRFECSEGFLYDPSWKRCRRHVFKELPMPVVDMNSAPGIGLTSLWMLTLLVIIL